MCVLWTHLSMLYFIELWVMLLKFSKIKLELYLISEATSTFN